MRFSDVQEPDELVVALPQYLAHGDVLDVGAGQGRDAFYLAAKGFSVTALEPDAAQVAVLQSKNAQVDHKIEIVQSDFLDFAPMKKYDVVVCDMLLHFFSQTEVLQAIEKIQGTTKVGGYNIIAAYSDKNPAGKRPYLFGHNELKSYYASWEIVVYQEKPTPWFVFPKGTKRRRNHAVYLFAQKLQ